MPDNWTNPFGGGSTTGNTTPGKSNTGGGSGWNNPFQKGKQTQKTADPKQPPEPTAPAIDPAELRKNWDYKTATTGMFGESLPDGAERWTPYGTPYFGGGIVGKLKEYRWMWTRDSSGPTSADWDNLWGRWGTALKDVGAANASKNGSRNDAIAEAKATGAESAVGGLAAETVSKAWQAGTSDGSIVSPVLRALGIGIKGVMDLFGAGAYYTERVGGAGEGAHEAFRELGLETLPDYNAETDNWFTRQLAEMNPLRTAGSMIKFALSPRKDKWDVFNQSVREGWDAGRIYYSGVYDQSVREEFLRRYRAGEDPELLAMELENPIAEMVGQVVFDPLNLLGVISKAKTVDRVLDASEMAVKASGTLADGRALAIVEDFGKLGKGDDVKAAGLFDEFARIQMDSVEAIKKGKLTQEYGYTKLAASSNRNIAVREAQNFIGIMQATARGAGRKFDEVADFIRAGVMSVGNDPEEVAKGVAGLMRFDSPKLMFSESGIKTFTMIRRMLTNEEGVLDASKILALTKVDNTDDFMKGAVKLIEAGAKESFPTVDELADAFREAEKIKGEGAIVGKKTSDMAEQFKRLPKTVLAANFLDGKGKTVYGPLNRILGKFYFSLQGGVAVKNILNNSVQILIDQGPRAFVREMEYSRALEDGTIQIVKRPAFWSSGKVKADLEKMIGFTTSLGSGFETQADTLKASGPFAKLMSWGEAEGANRVVWSSMRDSMRKLMSERYLGDATTLRNAGMSDRQINHLFRLFNYHAGDTAKVLEDFRRLHGAGAVDEWRMLDFIPKHYEDGFRELDVWDEIVNFANLEGKSQTEVEDFFGGLKKSIEARGRNVAQDGARITENTPGFDSLQKLEQELKDGDVTGHAANEILKTWLVAADEAKQKYFETLQNAIDWANRRLPESQSIPLSERMNGLRRGEYEGLAQAKTKANEIIESARQWSQEVRNQKNPTPEWLRAKWKEIGIKGEPPENLDKEGLQIFLWKYHREWKGSVWQDYYGTVFQESRSIVEDLGKATDITELRAQLTQAETAVEKANALRTSVYKRGTFYAKPSKRDLYTLAAQYDIPYQSASGRPNEKLLLNIVNRFNGTPGYNLPKVGDVMEEFQVANDFPTGNPLSLIKEHGGINAKEWGDIVGGRMGRDVKGVILGLFKKDKKVGAFQVFGSDKLGIDETGRLLAEYGYITEQQAEDANYVRDYIRAWINKDPKVLNKTKTYVRYFSEEDVARAEAAANDLPEFDEAGNWVFPKRPNQQFTKLDDVPGDVAIESFINWKAGQGGTVPDPQQVLNSMAMTPAYPSGSLPSVARAWDENTRPALYALDSVKNQILERWGKKVPNVGQDIDRALTEYVKGATPKIAEGKAVALKAAEHWRDFILHNYGAKTYGDLTWAYAMPYRFWYSRTYANWMKRLVSDPHIVAGYVKYKNLMAKLNADKPEFYRGQMEISGAFGFEFDHPLIFNLEAAINPLNGITGADFNDKERRINWWTSSLDDMNKMGPTLFAPLQWAVATALALDGEKDAAARWAGRAIPETAPLKSLLNLAAKNNINIPLLSKVKYGELDPMVQLFSGGLDPYERSRVGNSLAQMESNGLITQEQALDASYSQSGDLWDSAVQEASAGRLLQNGASWLIGVGFKPRTQADQDIESMFSELNVLYTLNKDGRLTPEQYRQSMDAMRNRYKFMDAVILARRGGDKRDSAYAYNVLGRLPPGASRDVLLSVGLDDKTIQKFYDSKGFTDSKIPFSKSEKSKFMLAIADLGAMLELPDYATRTEWNDAKNTYKAMSGGIATVLGDDIWDKVDTYYNLKDSNPDGAEAFKTNHPEVIQALQMRQSAVVNDPVLFDYYGSIDKLEAYFDGAVRQKLLEKYGDLTGIQSQYFDLKLTDSRAAKLLLRKHPELIRYWDEKRTLTEESGRAYVAIASRLPDDDALGLRSDFTPQTGQQEQMLNALQPDNAPSWGDVKSVVGNDLSPSMEMLVRAYWDQGLTLSAPADKQLDYLTARYGPDLGVDPTDTTSFLRMLGVAMTKGNQGNLLSQSGSAGGWSNPFAP